MSMSVEGFQSGKVGLGGIDLHVYVSVWLIHIDQVKKNINTKR